MTDKRNKKNVHSEERQEQDRKREEDKQTLRNIAHEIFDIQQDLKEAGK